MNTARLTRSIATLSSVLALASCGGLSGSNAFLEQSPRAIAQASITEMQDVSAMRILGNTTYRKSSMRVDIRVDTTNCIGSLDTDDGEIRILRNGEGAWIKADEEFWRSQAASPQEADRAVKAYRGSWVVVDERAEFLKMCDLGVPLKDFEVDTSAIDDHVDSDDVEEIGDVEAIPVDGRDRKERTTVWVAVKAPHYVLKIAPTENVGLPAELYFEEFGVKVVAESPSKKDIATIPGT